MGEGENDLGTQVQPAPQAPNVADPRRVDMVLRMSVYPNAKPKRCSEGSTACNGMQQLACCWCQVLMTQRQCNLLISIG